MIVGDTNPSTLATNLHILHHPWPEIKIETKLQTGAFASSLRTSIGQVEYLGENRTISLTLYNPKRDAGRMTIGFLQGFNNNFCAGVELLTEWSGSNRVQADMALAVRYVSSTVNRRSGM